MCSWCTFDLPHVTLKPALMLHSLFPFKFQCICKLICEKQPLATHLRGIRWNLIRFLEKAVDRVMILQRPHCHRNRLTFRSSLWHQRWWERGRRVGRLVPGCEVEQKWLCDAVGSTSPNNWLMRTTEGLLWQWTLLMLVGRMEGRRWMWRSGVRGPELGLICWSLPSLLIVYICFKISIGLMVNDGHESPRLFPKQYIISDPKTRLL